MAPIRVLQVMPAMDAGARPHVHNPIRRPHRVLVVFDYNQRIP